MYETKEYSIWKEDTGYMVKVKATGEVTPASLEVVRFLWAEDISDRRDNKDDSFFCRISLDESNEDGSAIIESISIGGARDVEDVVIWNFTNNSYKSQLSETQKKVYDLCYVKGLSGREAAAILGLSYSSIKVLKKRIADKFTKIS